MTIDESMRLYPPFWITPRHCATGDIIRGYTIPPGATVLVSQYVVHRHAEFWERPNEFYPEHFLPEKVASRPRFAYFPFGGGPRTCIGNHLALLVNQLVLGTVAQKVRLQLAEGWSVKTFPSTSLQPLGGIGMTIHAA